MEIKLYNTLSRKKETFKPINKGQVGIYSCGPTVYYFASIGNFVSFVFADILHRTLEHAGLKVTHVMNITDVGHLTSDADEGEDKMIVAMKREGKTAWEIAEFYTEAFYQDMDRLNIVRPKMVKATDHIAEQIELVKKLEENGFTYQTSDGIYFDTSKLKNYGQLSKQKAEDKKAGARVELGEKKNPTDFAVWKFSHKSDQGPSTGSGHQPERLMEWESPWGKGFPGWHLECSAMSVKYLGIPFDIHTGGIDHIPVHHENELAQSEGAYGKLQANVWMHNAFITVDGTKMSKSLNNIYTLDDLIEKGYEPLSYRYLLLGAHYRKGLNFTQQALEGAQNALNNLRDAARELDSPSKVSKDYEDRFHAAIFNDLDMPGALAVVWDMMNDKDLASADKAAGLLEFDRVLGLDLVKYVAKPLKVPAKVKKLVAERDQARADKDFKESDRLREEIEAAGFSVEDTPQGTKLREKR
ncbi:cysteine--tRNA ligase [Patescibacteria group bacterium]|nr:cysteine--tRNA ligase [Patescibacteria group bacterium]MBU1907465.1 cysteine--tRNA ligase [Patescibacteria group bacterium]